jgi:phosphoglycolate phosphatase/AHBA synthesis associated protein
VPGVSAVLFDLDGVLVDSFEAWLATVNEVAVRFGGAPFPRERIRAIFGQGVEADAETLYPGHAPAEIRRAYDETLPRHVPAVAVNPEARSVLDRLGRRGVRRAIVTNTQQSLAERILEAKGLAAAVDVVSAMRAGVREKPHPDLLTTALASLRVPPGSALMVGDSRYDEEAAVAAGVRFLRYEISRGASLDAALRPHVDGAASPA